MLKVEAPFTESQVASINGYQTEGIGHPFTCPNQHPEKRTLVAREEGLYCPEPSCDYTQFWVFTFMAEGEWTHQDAYAAFVQQQIDRQKGELS